MQHIDLLGFLRGLAGDGALPLFTLIPTKSRRINPAPNEKTVTFRTKTAHFAAALNTLEKWPRGEEMWD